MFDPSDYQLAWPREVFRAEGSELLQRDHDAGWSDAVELLLNEAFAEAHVARSFRDDRFEELPETWVAGLPVASGRGFLTALVRHVAELPVAGERPAYWSHRRSGIAPPPLEQDTVRAAFVRLIDDLYDRGYLDRHMPRGCVDVPGSQDDDPNDVLLERLGRPNLWPLRASMQGWDDDTFYDLVEVFHDLVARPGRRWWHSWDQCGWHVSELSSKGGRRVYLGRVNDLLGRSVIPYRLADAGEDAGRLVEVTDDARSDLVNKVIARDDPTTGDAVRHAVALFRTRGATEHDKRSAVITVAGVLESRRGLLKDELSKDEGALFQIANEFAIRHQRAGQKPDYDPVFLDWVFWWYLATVDLSDRLLERRGPIGTR